MVAYKVKREEVPKMDHRGTPNNRGNDEEKNFPMLTEKVLSLR